MGVNLANGLAVAVAISSSVLAVGVFHNRERSTAAAPQVSAATSVQQHGDSRGLRDASGRFVPLRDYQRIASASSVADSLLLELAEHERVIAISRTPAPDSPFAYRTSGFEVLPPLSDVEALIGLRADLLLVNSMDRIERLEQLRDAGVEVFDLGQMRGVETLLPNIRSVAILLGRAERGAELARRFERRMRQLASDIPEAQRPGALYIGVHGDKFYGGTKGSSFHDVLTAAGLRDVAAARFSGWPRYDSEELLMLDPEVIVTQTGMGQSLCAQAGLSRLRACSGTGRIIELSPDLILMPGLSMLDAAETLYERIH